MSRGLRHAISPGFLVFAGFAIAFGGQSAWLGFVFAFEPTDRWPATLAAFVPGLGLSILAPAVFLRGRRPARRYAIAGLFASAVAVLTPPGLVGGGLALAGAMWGLLRAYGDRTDRTRSDRATYLSREHHGDPGTMEKVKVGEVFHFFPKPGVAAIRVTDAHIKVGDTLLFQGPSTNFDQRIESMEIEKVKVTEATPGQSVGVKVRDRVREGDFVYKIVA